MEKLFAVLEVIVPIFVVVALGVWAKRKNVLNGENVQGLQRFVTKFCLPCVLFNSCLSATMELQSLTAMLCVMVTVFIGAVLSFWMKKRIFPYYNLPMLFAAQESGMLGIPLFLSLFGAQYMFRMGVLDVAQSFIAIPIIALLGTDAGESASVSKIVKSVLKSPLLIAAICGLLLNLSGVMAWMNEIGFGPVLTETTSFLAQPVSAAMLFSVGYNFSLGSGNRQKIFRLSAIHFAYFGAMGAIMILLLTLTGPADPLTIWAAVIYWTLPSSYLSPSFARNDEEAVISSGICSVLTVVSLMVFCVVAAITA